jgi:phosphohistidine phosphatase
MALYLVQHGKSLPKDQDPDQGLSQTAEILASALKPQNGIQEISGIKPMDDVAACAAKIDPEENVMLVGHLPFMERIASYLITGSIDQAVIKFQNSGIVCLDKDPETQSWVIKWTLMPNIG